ncbi:MAG TPA: DUF2203 domain-containing protein [Pyrinomonadaceae bacterium]|nr:DUF2203 domain-containing protein [Pyrinomonadaceae bacterium]
MKLFTVEEANVLIPRVREIVGRIQRSYERLGEYRDAAKEAAIASEFGGGMEGGATYVKTLYEIGKLTTELHTLGVQLKDYSQGLVDFPSMRDDRVVLLCWQMGEGDEIEWWHDEEAGFAGRRPL